MDAVSSICRRRAAATRRITRHALRRRFPEYTRARQAWRDAVVIEAILATVLQAIDEYRLSTRAAVDERRYVPLGDVRQPSGFMPWRLFKHRAPVTRAPGIYVFAYFEGDPEPVVDPLSRNVIYIGKATSIASRLEHFETSAQSAEIGHSGGFSYRVQFAEMQFGSNPILLRQFHNTFCTWRIVSLKAEQGPREVEKALIAAYRNKWGNWPILNRTS